MQRDADYRQNIGLMILLWPIILHLSIEFCIKNRSSSFCIILLTNKNKQSENITSFKEVIKTKQLYNNILKEEYGD